MKLFAIVVFLFLSLSVFSQFENILISTVNNPEEPSIYINTKNPALIMAGANIHSQYLSQDSGRTWARSVLTSDSSGVWGDPCIVSDTAGDFYFIHLSNPPTGSWIDRIACQKYDVSLGMWTYDSYMGLNPIKAEDKEGNPINTDDLSTRPRGYKAQDKAWLVVDPATNNLYVTWTEFDRYGSANPEHESRIMFSRSLDGGATWSQAKQINNVNGDCIDSDNTVEGAVPAVGPNGEIYVAWAGPLGLVFDRSLDTGNTWLANDIFVNTIPGGWDFDVSGIYRANGLPITVCDLSGGPNSGDIYINWSDQRNGNTDVWLVKSTDGGNNWTSPLKVNDDTTQTHQFFTWMSIDQVTGYLYFVFYDRRAYGGDTTDVFLAITRDGGQTFENHRISKSPFVPNHNIFFGDYTNISAQNGMVRPIWTRLNNDSLSVWTALINLDSINTFIDYPSNPNAEAEADVYPNPTTSQIAFSYKIKAKTFVSLEVIDNLGKKIAVLIDGEERRPGMYIEHFDIRNSQLSTGVYYFVLSQEGKKNLVKKFIVN